MGAGRAVAPRALRTRWAASLWTGGRAASALYPPPLRLQLHTMSLLLSKDCAISGVRRAEPKVLQELMHFGPPPLRTPPRPCLSARNTWREDLQEKVESRDGIGQRRNWVGGMMLLRGGVFNDDGQKLKGAWGRKAAPAAITLVSSFVFVLL